MAAIYQGEYHLRRGHGGDAAIEALKIATTNAYLKMLERMGAPGRRLVDVGCSAGSALEAAARRGWTVEGIELSPESCEVARRRPGGLVLMVTPDAGSLSARLMGSRWPHLFEEHVIIYTREALSQALARAGLQTQRSALRGSASA